MDLLSRSDRGTRVGIPEWLSYSLLALIALLAFGDVVSYPYAWDDLFLIELTVEEALQIPPEGVHVRPIWYLTHAITSRVVGAAWFDHLVNLLLFVAGVLLAYHYARTVTTDKRAALATVLWMLVPWNVYPVAWIAQRNDLLIFVFVFAALLALRGKRFGLAVMATSLAVFSKITAAFFPLYVAWRLRAEGKRPLAVGTLVVFAVYWALAIPSYLRFRDVGEHLADLPLAVGMLRFPLHWAEHLVLLAVPVPFFTGWLHAGVYGVFLLAAAAGARAARERWVEEQGLEILAIALLLSIPTMVTPHLRICGLETFFWILLLTRSVSFSSGVVRAIALVAFLASSVWGGLATKEILRTQAERSNRGERPGLYPNQYYGHRNELVRGLAERFFDR